MGDSCAQGGKPGIKETGTPEDVPRTAAITHAADTKKAPADVMGALLRLELHGFPHPVAELAATTEGYRAGLVPATFESPWPQQLPATHELQALQRISLPFFRNRLMYPVQSCDFVPRLAKAPQKLGHCMAIKIIGLIELGIGGGTT